MTDVAPALELPPDMSAGNSRPELRCSEPGCDFEAKPGVMAKAQLANHRRSHGFKKAPQPKAAPKAAKERAPRTAPPSSPRTGRRSAAKFLGPLWLAAAQVVPGRAGGLMVWEAPAAGAILDKLAAGSIVDRLLLQRLCKEEDRWGDLASLLILPGIGSTVDSGAYANMPEVLQRAIQGVAEDSIVRMLGAVLEDMERRKGEIEKLERKAQAAGIQPGEDGAMRAEVERLLAVLFAPVAPQGAPVAPPQYQPA